MNDPNTSAFFEGEFTYIYDELNFTYNSTDVYAPDSILVPCDTMHFSDAVITVVCLFYVLVFLLAIPGNLIVGLVIGLSKQELTPSDLYLLHLAIADIVLAFTIPFWATSITVGWVFGDALCKIISILQELSFYVSILFLACISVDRYLVIVRAMEVRNAYRGHLSWSVCAGVWFAGGLLSLPGLLNYSTSNSSNISYSSNNTHLAAAQCTEQYDPSSAKEWRQATRWLRHILGFIIPMIVMFVCYGGTIQRLLRTRRGFQRQRAMRVIVTVVAAFLLCWTPYHLTVMADSFFRLNLVPYDCPARTAVDRAMFVTQSLGLLHSCVNPVLYAFVGEKFRRRLKQILRKNGILEKPSVLRASRSSMSSEMTSTVM